MSTPQEPPPHHLPKLSDDDDNDVDYHHQPPHYTPPDYPYLPSHIPITTPPPRRSPTPPPPPPPQTLSPPPPHKNPPSPFPTPTPPPRRPRHSPTPPPPSTPHPHKQPPPHPSPPPPSTPHPHKQPPPHPSPPPPSTPHPHKQPPPHPSPPSPSTPHKQQPSSPPPTTLSPPPPPHKRPRPRLPYDYDYDYDGGYNPTRRRFFAVIVVLLILIGLTALILWLIYRPHNPKFTAISTAIYNLTTTGTTISSTLQFTILTRNTNKRTALYYDHLTATVLYNNHPITPPVNLPPLLHRKRSAVMMSPLIGAGAGPVFVPVEVANGLVADAAYGVVALSWVLTGRVRYRAGWFKSTDHSRVYVRCDVLVAIKGGGGGAYSNPGGQVPLLGNPPCLVDI